IYQQSRQQNEELRKEISELKQLLSRSVNNSTVESPESWRTEQTPEALSRMVDERLQATIKNNYGLANAEIQGRVQADLARYRQAYPDSGQFDPIVANYISTLPPEKRDFEHLESAYRFGKSIMAQVNAAQQAVIQQRLSEEGKAGSQPGNGN